MSNLWIDISIGRRKLGVVKLMSSLVDDPLWLIYNCSHIVRFLCCLLFPLLLTNEAHPLVSIFIKDWGSESLSQTMKLTGHRLAPPVSSCRPHNFHMTGMLSPVIGHTPQIWETLMSTLHNGLWICGLNGDSIVQPSTYLGKTICVHFDVSQLTSLETISVHYTLRCCSLHIHI